MKLEIIISGREEARLAAEFMARITAIRFPVISTSDIAEAVKEEAAGVVADQAIEKAAKPSKSKKPDAVAPIDTVAEPAVQKVDRAALQRLAAAKASGGKAVEVKAAIADYGTKIIEVPEEKLAELLSRLEAL